jgi:hypothetical protein
VPKNSPTFDHMRSKRFEDDGAVLPDWMIGHPTFVPRLTFKGSTFDPTDRVAADLGEHLGRADVAIFCDTSIFDDRLDQQQLWRPVLDGPATVMLVGKVVDESLAYLQERSTHPVVEGLKSKLKGVVFGADVGLDGDALEAGEYYVTLLRSRRRAQRLFEGSGLQQQAHPAPVDIPKVRQELQRSLGNRIAKLVNKAGSNEAGTDEHLVYVAVEAALRTGRQSIILTRDWDIEEQFYKLIWLLDTHYRSMLLARMYRRDFATFRPRQLIMRGVNDKLFVGNDNVWFFREPTLRFVLPPAMSFVPISVLRVTDRLTQLTFGGEQGMREVLKVKARNDGRNTDLLGDRNLHVSGAVAQASEDGRDVALVVRDRQWPVPGSQMHVGTAGCDSRFGQWGTTWSSNGRK